MKQAVRPLLQAQAHQLGISQDQARRQWLIQRLLARVFQADEWVLKGGTGLLARLPTARHSQDADLLYRLGGPDQAVTALRDLIEGPSALDPLTFRLGEPRTGPGGVVHVNAMAMLGSTKYGDCPIDLSTDLDYAGTLERARPTAVIEVEGIAPLPEFVLYPLPDQVADKLAALYEVRGRDGAVVSTRYRDLVDLVEIVRAFPLEAGPVLRALQVQRAVRPLLRGLPSAVGSPGPLWSGSYPGYAARSGVPAGLRSLEVSLAVVGACLDPLLSGDRVEGTWDPAAGCWRD